MPFSIKPSRNERCPLLDIYNELNPEFIKVNNMKVQLLQTSVEKTQQIVKSQEFENKLLSKVSPSTLECLPIFQVNVGKNGDQAPPHATEDTEIDKQEMLNDPSIIPPHYHIPLSQMIFHTS